MLTIPQKQEMSLFFSASFSKMLTNGVGAAGQLEWGGGILLPGQSARASTRTRPDYDKNDISQEIRHLSANSQVLAKDQK